jgi:hypothetical protein
MKKILITGTLIIVCGCASARGRATGNAGQAALVGTQASGQGSTSTTAAFNPHDMGTASAGRDLATSLSFVGGNIGLTLVALALCGVAYAAVRKA